MLKSNIKEIRQKKNISQEELARMCEISARTIQNLERDGNRTIEILIKVKNALNCTLDELFFIDNKEE